MSATRGHVLTLELSDWQLDELADRVAARLAGLADVDEHQGAPASTAPRLVDAAELARELGVSRSFVYAHADELGAVRLGARAEDKPAEGKRHGGPRLRFDLEASRAAMARSTSDRSDEPDHQAAQRDRAPMRRRRDRRPPARLPEPDSVLPITPLRAGRPRASAQAKA